VRALCEIAEKRGAEGRHALRRDPTIRCRGKRDAGLRDPAPGLQGRVAGSHLTSMHSMDNYYVSKLLPLMAEANIMRSPIR